MAENRAVACSFMAQWALGIAALRASIRDYFTDDTVWENVGFNRLLGAHEAIAFIDKYHDEHGLDAIVVEIMAMVADDRCVMTERVDHLFRADGSAMHSTRIMGVFEIHGNKIVAQRDYFSASAA